jgi:hypothetical protein
MNKAQVAVSMVVLGLFASGIFFGMTAMATPKFEAAEAIYYAPYEGDSGECELTIKNAGGGTAYNVTIVLKNENDVVIIQSDEGNIGASVSFKIRATINRSTANQGIKITITYTFKNSGGKIVSNTEKIMVKPKSIIP